jgi:Tfp pilus assembly protein PilO
MKRLTKQKRDQLILASIVILMVLAGIYFFLIRAQKESLQALRAQKIEQETKVGQMQDKIKNSKAIETQLNAVAGTLAVQEEEMASGDLYASLVNTIRKFKLHYKLDIPQFSPASSVMDEDLLPRFPYKQVKITISGTGYYEEIGKFVADFENEYSASRVLNLELVPTPGVGPESKEKLTFRMDVVSLVASGVTTPANSR